jgi:hypothetical protein
MTVQLCEAPTASDGACGRASHAGALSIGLAPFISVAQGFRR